MKRHGHIRVLPRPVDLNCEFDRPPGQALRIRVRTQRLCRLRAVLQPNVALRVGPLDILELLQELCPCSDQPAVPQHKRDSCHHTCGILEAPRGEVVVERFVQSVETSLFGRMRLSELAQHTPASRRPSHPQLADFVAYQRVQSPDLGAKPRDQPQLDQPLRPGSELVEHLAWDRLARLGTLAHQRPLPLAQSPDQLAQHQRGLILRAELGEHGFEDLALHQLRVRVRCEAQRRSFLE